MVALLQLPSELHLMIAGCLDPESDLVANRAHTTQFALYRVNRYFFRLLDPLFTSAALLYSHEDPNVSRHVEKLKDLLQRGAKPNTRDPRPENVGATALHYAAKYGNKEACKILLEAGAEVNLQYEKEAERLSPLLLAVRKGHVEVAELLLDHGADIELSGCIHDCVTPLRSAIYRRDEPMLKMLLKRGANPNRQDIAVNATVGPPLFYARPASIMRIMLENGADPNIRDERGVTALSHFENHPHLMDDDKKSIAAVLREFNGKLNI